MRDDLLRYYERELAYVRQLGAEFAQKNPGVASRLLLEPDKCADPYVERLIEAFSFIAARIHLKLDDDFPEITESLLNVLYPHYLSPIPSMCVAQFALDPEQGKLTTGYQLARHTYLDSRRIRSTRCRFRTCYPVTLWPIEVASASLKPLVPEDSQGRWQRAVVEINLRCANNVKLSELEVIEEGSPPRPIESLRFYLAGEAQLVYALYEMLFNSSSRVELEASTSSGGAGRRPGHGAAQSAPVAATLRQVGFAEDEGLLPYTRRSFMGYRLLTEYFAFPQKFLFFDVNGLDTAARRGDFGTEFSLRIYLNNISRPPGEVTAATFQLGCAPVVNLFDTTAEPISLTRLKNEYRIVVDTQREEATEVYSVREVNSTDSHLKQTRRYEPFYSIRHAVAASTGQTFWYATRRASQRKDDNGTEVFLTLVDLGFKPSDPSEETVKLEVTASNRDLPGELNPGAEFQVEGAGPLVGVRCLGKPTGTFRPPLLRGAQWRLISHLSLNHLSIHGNEEEGATQALREILKLYDFADSPVTRNQIMGISRVTSRLATGKMAAQAGERIGTGFVRGIRTTVEFDEQMYVGGVAYLFASVLEHFLRLYASVNSFNQLEAWSKQRGLLKRWPVTDSSNRFLAQPFDLPGGVT